ncbi:MULTISPECIES: SDR family oxidoreductase [Halomonas]|uniref:SDR family oxidoreductase n=1 Tax=Halomonas TaxID=2745 RepID=UPI001C93BFE7|nr:MULTISPECIES: SDR family oxidoreductase [Halomonas]MED5294252.1 SDR family oxidoreductase [Pseudomonadota bacterium]MBY5926853.1 SDR family oxidoreductase [Halomonas sp. DP4Y7-2]MBY5970200.1 SDR family oxidoreductase [Halomonas denitrificans]MBY6206682.1 SDR family oxidoreductase [Halomonas sp. DP3Y7-2]MBY6230213.1 SDR family oxidoreductase [Halomonas sp. DP3Y7-1]
MAIEDKRVIIITGGARGIGADIARRLASDGHQVVINYANSRESAESLVEEIEAQGGVALAVAADVTRPADVTQLFEAASQRFGRVDGLVNNAGTLSMVPLAESSDSDYDHHFDTNVRGTFNTLREAASRLEDGGRIVNLSSSALALNLPGYGLYNATKAAVESLTKVFAGELRGRRITVNAVAPGPVDTALFRRGKSAEQIESFAQKPPLERLGEPKDIAAIVSFLMRAESEWINAQVIRANGGFA